MNDRVGVDHFLHLSTTDSSREYDRRLHSVTVYETMVTVTGGINLRVRQAALGVCVVTALAGLGVSGCGGSDTSQSAGEAAPSKQELQRRFARELKRGQKEEAREEQARRKQRQR